MSPQVVSIYNHPDNQDFTEINSNGIKIWINSAGQYHREGDKPAFIHPDGTVEYWKEGKRHRKGDKPAIIYPGGTVSYWKEGKCHRDGDKPAYINYNGTIEYYKEGKLHREGDNSQSKPAFIKPNGLVEYWENGKHIRTGNASPEDEEDRKLSVHESKFWIESLEYFKEEKNKTEKVRVKLYSQDFYLGLEI